MIRIASGKILALILALAVGLVFTTFSGENPLHVLQILARSAFGSPYDFGMTLSFAVPLVFVGLSVATAFQSGLFNIGAEGQLNIAAITAVIFGVCFPGLPFPLAPLGAALAAMTAGAAWAGIAGWIRAKRGGHEVIVTIMLNFIAAAICSWLTLNPLKNTSSQYPETLELASAYRFSFWSFFQGAPVGPMLGVAAFALGVMGIMFFRTRLGFVLRSVGQNETACEFSGINPARIKITAMMWAGALAGMVGVAEVLGNAGKYRLEFSPGYGFLGIAVALLGGNHPIGILFSALLFGALHKGASDLDLETERVTREVSDIFQALIILFVSAQFQISWREPLLKLPARWGGRSRSGDLRQCESTAPSRMRRGGRKRA